MALRHILISLLAIAMVNAVAVEGALPFFGSKKKRQQRDPISVQNAKAEELMELAQAAVAKNNRKTALRYFKTISKKYPNSRYAPHALYEASQIYIEKRKWKKAFEGYYFITRGYPNFEKFNTVLNEEFEIASALMDKKSSRYFSVIPYRNYDSAVQFFETIVASAPYSEYAPLSLMNIAIIQNKRGNRIFAVDALDRLINSYPRSMLAPDAYLELAETFSSMVDGPRYDQGATREAIRHYEDFLILYPDSPEVAIGETGLSEMQDVFARSKLEMGEFYYKKRPNYRAAEVFFNEAITVAPNSPSANKARDYLAVIETIPEEMRIAKASRQRRPRKTRRGLMFWKKKQIPEAETEVAQNDSPSPPPPTQTVEVEKESKKERTRFARKLIFWRKNRAPEGPNSDN